MRLTDEREQFIRETGGGFADIAVLLGEVDALRGERDAITQESVANMAASIEFEAQLNAALARAEAAEAERDQWMSACDAAVEEARGYYEAMDRFRSDLDECRAARDEWATKDMEDYRRAVAAETRIAAALAIIERGENVDVGDEDDHAVFALGWGNAAAELRAALVEPVGPKEDA